MAAPGAVRVGSWAPGKPAQLAKARGPAPVWDAVKVWDVGRDAAKVWGAGRAGAKEWDVAKVARAVVSLGSPTRS